MDIASSAISHGKVYRLYRSGSGNFFSDLLPFAPLLAGSHADVIAGDSDDPELLLTVDSLRAGEDAKFFVRATTHLVVRRHGSR